MIFDHHVIPPLNQGAVRFGYSLFHLDLRVSPNVRMRAMA